MTSVGMNLSSVRYYSNESPFLDRFKTAREWLAGDTKLADRSVATDSLGNPLAVPTGSANISTLFAVDPIAEEMTDRYVVTYSGTARFAFGSAKIISSEPGKIVIEVTNTTNNRVQMIAAGLTDKDPLRDIHIVREDQVGLFKAGEIFNPAFLEKVEDFDTLRFMDWGATNYSEPVSWATRNQPNDAIWASNATAEGVPLEIMVRLSNETQADMWYNVPTTADDTYVRNALTYIRDHLDPTLKVHVEWSNEVWNSNFKAYDYAKDKGSQLWGKDANHDGRINPADSKETVSGASMLYYGYRSAQIADIGNKVFGSQAEDRLETVLSGQASYASLTTTYTIKGIERAGVGKVDDLFSEYAITTYFGGDMSVGNRNAADQAKVLGWARGGDAGMAEAFKQLEFGGALSQSDSSLKGMFEFLTKQAAIADQYGMDLVAYESGAHLVASNFPAAVVDEIQAFIGRLMSDPRMGDLYTKMVDGFAAIGGTELMGFSNVGGNSEGGYWGVLDTIYQDGSPRYDALLAAALKDDANAPVTPPKAAPVEVLVSVKPLTIDDDYNGDGRSDLLVRHDNGKMVGWSSTGTGFTQNTLAASPNSKWTLIDTLDQNGDGKDDILFRQANGDISIWKSTGTALVQDSFTDKAGADRTVAVVGDFTGDGKDDILWTKANGGVALWASTGSAFTKDSWTHAPVASGMKVAGSGDFDGDGREDVLWRDAAGAVSIWSSDGTGFVEKSAVAGPGAAWQIKGIGDFDGNGADDVLWRNQAGAVMVWEAERGAFVGSTHADASMGRQWSVEQVGDFTGDGRADILWRNANGSLNLWASTDSGFTKTVLSNTNGPQWHIVSDSALFD